MSSATAHVRILRTVGEGGLYWMYTVPRCRAYVVSYVGIVCPVSCQAQVSLQEKKTTKTYGKHKRSVGFVSITSVIDRNIAVGFQCVVPL